MPLLGYEERPADFCADVDLSDEPVPSDAVLSSDDSKPEYSRPFHQTEWCWCAVAERSKSQLNIGSPKTASRSFSSPECALRTRIKKLGHTATASRPDQMASAGW